MKRCTDDFSNTFPMLADMITYHYHQTLESKWELYFGGEKSDNL